MKTLLPLLSLLLTAYLTVSSYDVYRVHQFRVSLEHQYGNNHYKLKQMASDDILCTDNREDWCLCGHCQ